MSGAGPKVNVESARFSTTPRLAIRKRSATLTDRLKFDSSPFPRKSARESFSRGAVRTASSRREVAKFLHPPQVTSTVRSVPIRKALPLDGRLGPIFFAVDRLPYPKRPYPKGRAVDELDSLAGNRPTACCRSLRMRPCAGTGLRRK
jgi:hypothetical protein